MRPPLVLAGMHGLGDNLHQRAIVRQLMPRFDVWLETSWFSVYHDLIEQGLKVMRKPTPLRTQSKNAAREAALFSTARPPLPATHKRIVYSPELVRRERSVLGAMCAATGCDYAAADFRLPIPPAWRAKADAVLAAIKPDRPILIYRPLNERKEWGGCPARNPDYSAYAALLAAIRPQFFVLSIADLKAGEEWLVGEPVQADATFHEGQLDFETIAALTQSAALVYSSPGFAIVLAQAVGTPAIAVFGGYERAYSFAGGARFSAYLGIEPIVPCDCFSHSHNCQKRVDLEHARTQVAAFARAAADRAIAA